MLLQDKKIVKFVQGAMLLAFSVIISIVEAMFPLLFIIPFPGVRLGLCNIAVAIAFYKLGLGSALTITIVRPVFLLLLNGNVFSFILSVTGAFFSLISLQLTKKMYGRLFSYCGVSCISATFHSVGQILVIFAITQNSAIFSYLPFFITASSIMGSISGSVMNLIIPKFDSYFLNKEGQRGL